MKMPKFRAWDKVNNKLVDVISINFSLETVFAKVNSVMAQDVEAYDFVDENIELMQSTGLEDKNGTEIFEGDILRYFEDKIGVVKHHKHQFYVEGFYCADMDIPYDAFSENIEFEVIGNIYENSELLKGDQL